MVTAKKPCSHRVSTAEDTPSQRMARCPAASATQKKRSANAGALTMGGRLKSVSGVMARNSGDTLAEICLRLVTMKRSQSLLLATDLRAEPLPAGLPACAAATGSASSSACRTTTGGACGVRARAA
jgi:hypothetical protein